MKQVVLHSPLGHVVHQVVLHSLPQRKFEETMTGCCYQEKTSSGFVLEEEKEGKGAGKSSTLEEMICNLRRRRGHWRAGGYSKKYQDGRVLHEMSLIQSNKPEQALKVGGMMKQSIRVKEQSQTQQQKQKQKEKQKQKQQAQLKQFLTHLHCPSFGVPSGDEDSAKQEKHAHYNTEASQDKLHQRNRLHLDVWQQADLQKGQPQQQQQKPKVELAEPPPE